MALEADLSTFLVGKEKARCKPLRGGQVSFRKDGALRRVGGVVIVCDKVCLMSASSLPFCDKSQSSLVDENSFWEGDL